MAARLTFTSLFLLLVLLFNTIDFSSAYQLRGGGWIEKGRRVGRRVEIENVESNEEIQAFGKFSVEEYNREQQSQLAFVRVFRAERQVVSGVKYYLKIHAWDYRESFWLSQFDAVVVVKPWRAPSKQLLSFAPSSS